MVLFSTVFAIPIGLFAEYDVLLCVLPGRSKLQIKADKIWINQRTKTIPLEENSVATMPNMKEGPAFEQNPSNL